MPGRLKVRIIAGRHLPIMDRASDLTDAFVEVKFGSVTHKTEVFDKSLNPLWNSDWFKFEVDDTLLQDEPLQIRVLDHDTYSAHDAIGKIYIDIDPLLDISSSRVLCGWFPIYDTMHGIRGEILLTVKLELFADVNQFKQTSCGFKFICGAALPECYTIKRIHGFVHELLANEDPEYKWIDKLRTPRASNEARQRLFSKMTGELQRRIGSKVETIGGNAVMGYQQSFDIEGDSGIVVRGIGTAVTIEDKKKQKKSFLFKQSLSVSSSPGKTSNDFPFYTMKSFPPTFLVRLSIVVTAHSVKLLEKIHSQDDAETRDSWWNELRQEIKTHCVSLSCNAVIGYTEHASMCDEVVILSAQGTAAVVNPLFSLLTEENERVSSVHEKGKFHKLNGNDQCSRKARAADESLSLLKIPPELTELAYPMKYQPSPLNYDVLVPNVFFATVALPPNIETRGKGTLVQARYCRGKKKVQGESNAALISDILPFIEYELHKRLYNAVKVRGMNALFGLESTVTLGENIVVGIASGTAVCLEALPTTLDSPSTETLSEVASSKDSFQKKYSNFTKKCEDIFQLKYKMKDDLKAEKGACFSDTSGNQRSLSMDGKRSMVIGVGDALSQDEDLRWLITKYSLPPSECHLSNLDICPGVRSAHSIIQTFSLLWRARYSDDADDKTLNDGLTRCCEQALNAVWFRLRRKSPVCFVTMIKFFVVLADDDELQIWITGSALIEEEKKCEGVETQISFRNSAPVNTGATLCTRSLRLLSPHDDSIEPFESDDEESLGLDEAKSLSFLSRPMSPHHRKLKRSSTSRSRHFSEGGNYIPDIDTRFLNKMSEPITITPMSFLPNRAVVRHIGILNMFIIRETTSVRGSDEDIPMAEPVHGTGCSWFISRSLTETNALIRAHVVALGGNALTSYQTSYCLLKESLAKNEAQCLLHVTGDVVLTMK